MRLAYVNGGLWAIGNGLASTTLVVYLAIELGAAGLAIGLILATPRLVGLLRLATPLLIDWTGDRRRFCLLSYLASNFLLLLLPVFSAPGALESRTASLAALVILWSTYHLLEYCGTVALWSWLGDLTPRRIRGRFFGRRERWLTLGRILGMAVTGLFAYGWREATPRELWWIGYSIPAGAGGIMMILSLIPLRRMPAIPLRKDAATGRLRSLALPFRDGRYWRLVFYGIWFSIVNGITQSAQGIYPYGVLGIHLLWMLALESAMRLGQGGASPWLGRLVDRLGCRPVMIASQLVVAVGPLFYLWATPDEPGWIAGAWISWVAYAGINVALPALMLKLSRGSDSSPYIATWFGVSGVFYGASTIAGGVAFDYLAEIDFSVAIGRFHFDRFEYLFLFGCAGRALAAGMLLLVIEPGARPGGLISTRSGKSRPAEF